MELFQIYPAMRFKFFAKSNLICLSFSQISRARSKARIIKLRKAVMCWTFSINNYFEYSAKLFYKMFIIMFYKIDSRRIFETINWHGRDVVLIAVRYVSRRSVVIHVAKLMQMGSITVNCSPLISMYVMHYVLVYV